ncbi:MAG: hypothetical protein ABR521_07755 [Gaiellaceae bacterium]
MKQRAPGGADVTVRGGSGGSSSGAPVVSRDLHHDTSRPLRELPQVPFPVPVTRPPDDEAGPPTFSDGRPDPLVQRGPATGRMPAPIQSFPGLQNNDNAILGVALTPPDTNGDVGPNHYVQMVNVVYAVYSKTGTIVAGFPKAQASIWTGFGTAGTPEALCRETDQGDPVVVYDQLAGRWVLTKFAFGTDAGSGDKTGPYVQCIAVSATGDATGAFHRYAFLYDNCLFNDYPHFGVWPDAYYMAANQFTTPTPACQGAPGTEGGGAAAYERTKMLNGDPALQVVFKNGVNNASVPYAMLPSDLDGATSPPAGRPNFYLHFEDDDRGAAADQLALYKFSVDFGNPGASTFAGPDNLPTAFNSMFTCAPAGDDCFPQPGTTQKLDALADRLMFRLAYRNFGTHESLVVNHTVNVGNNHGGVRWYELRSPNTAPTIAQQGVYSGDGAGDTHDRWMGSVAQDRLGNLAAGYSITSSTVFPSVRYVGRLTTDPAGTLPQGEATLVAGGGSQDGSNRWGDYSDMTVDPVDDCTFWYTQEYYDQANNNTTNWQTRIGSFKFANCVGPTIATLLGVNARVARGVVTLTWRTASETGTAGFEVWRTGGGQTTKLTRGLIPAKHAGRSRGAAYRVVDRGVRRGTSYTYRLRVVGTDGRRAWRGSVTAGVR